MYCRMLESHCRAVGVDPSQGMLEVARQRVAARTLLARGRAGALPLASEMFDFTIAARSLCHEPDLSGAFRELGRITRSGGLCVVSDIHARHDYPQTRIPLGNQDVHIETIKRTSSEIENIATESGSWEVEFACEMRWQDLNWAPEDRRFVRIDRQGHRPIFFIVALRRH